MTPEEYAAKREARYNRLIAAAEKAEKESTAAWNQARSMAEVIPFGQPILIGHHSERRDRNYRARIESKHRRGYELHQRAEELRSRAEAAQNNNAIFTEDPEAAAKLGDKVSILIEVQERYKAINAAHKKYLKNPASLDACDLTDAEKEIIRNYVPTYSWTPHPIAPFTLTNLSAQIRTAKKRAAQVEKQQAIPDKDETIDTIRIEWRPSENRIRVIYPARVDLATFKKLRQHGYKAMKETGHFSAYYNNNAAWYIKELREQGEPQQ